jgi:hypothetical protein
MMAGRLPRWSLVSATVVEHTNYGLLVRLTSGETSGEVGVVDSGDIGDGPVPPAPEWPPVGSVITVVGGGYTSAGQLRLSARPSHIAEASARQVK